MRNSEFIRFDVRDETGKTTVYEVVNSVTSMKIGVVKWYGAWRKYGFFPNECTVYDPDCLFTIAEFCERVSKEHYDGKR